MVWTNRMRWPSSPASASHNRAVVCRAQSRHDDLIELVLPLLPVDEESSRPAMARAAAFASPSSVVRMPANPR
jgi:hypothetical protein